MFVNAIKNLLYPNTTIPLTKMLNLWDVQDNIIVGVDGSLSVVYNLKSLPDVVHFDISTEESFINNFKRALLSLPDNFVVQFVVSGRWGNYDKIEKYKNLIETDTSISQNIIKAKTQQFQKLNSRRLYYKFVITLPPDNLYKINSDPFYYRKLFNTKKYLENVHQQRVLKLNSGIDNFIKELNSVGIKTYQLTTDEIVRDIYKILNPTRYKVVDFVPKPAETLRSQVIMAPAENKFSELFIDGYYYRGVNLYSRPENINFFHVVRFMSKLEVDFDVVFTIHYIEDNMQSDNKVRKDLKFQATLSASSMTKEGRIRADEINRMLDDTIANNQRIFNFSLCAIVRDKELSFLNSKTDSALSAFRELGDAEGIVDDMNHLQLFLTTVPGNYFYNTRTHPFHHDALAHFLPISQSWQGCHQPKMLFPTSSGEIIGIDLWDKELPAKHGLIIGSTGSGKSFTTNYILTNFKIESDNNHIIIIDVGGSYRKFCELFDGQYIDIKYSDEYAFNPFPAKQFVMNETEVDPDTISFLVLIVQKMLKRDSLSGNEIMILENTIKNLYKNTSSESPTLGEFAELLKDYSGDTEDTKTAMTFFKDLGPWVSGRFSILLNNPKSKLVLDHNKQVVVFDLQKLVDEPDLGPVMFFVIRSAIQSRLANLNLKKLIVIDEGWQFFSDESGSKLIENLYRTARKFNGAVLSISQSPEDFLKTKASTSIIANSYTKYFLRLTKGHELLPAFDLTEPEIEEVKNLEMIPKRYSEVFFKFLDKCAVLKIQPNKLDYWICTTDAKDRVIENEYREKYHNLKLHELIFKIVTEVEL